MKKTLTCILCPNSCEIQIDYSQHDNGLRIQSIQGQSCKKGEDYARQELIAPMRTISSSVLITGGTIPLLSVRLSAPVPRSAIPAVMQKVRKLRLTAPVRSGSVLVKNIAGLSSDLIATRSVEAAE